MVVRAMGVRPALLAFALTVLAVFTGCEVTPGESSSGVPLASQPTAERSESPAVLAPTPIPEPTPTLEIPTVLPTTVTPTAPSATVTAEGCYDRGFAGRIRDPNDRNVDIYLMVEPPDDPADDARAIAETLCSAGGRYVPSGKVRTMKIDYSLQQLRGWYALLNQTRQVDGVYLSSVSVASNRIHYEILTESGKGRLEDQVVAAGVPLEAVFIQVREQIGPDDPPVKTRSGYGVELSIEFASEVPSGGPVEFSVVVTNILDSTLELEHGEPPEVDIVILTPDGRQVWRFLTPVRMGAGKSSDILPGESIRFPVTWPQLDDDGFQVPPDRYLVRGFIRFVYHETRDAGNFAVTEELSTAPETIRVIGE